MELKDKSLLAIAKRKKDKAHNHEFSYRDIESVNYRDRRVTFFSMTVGFFAGGVIGGLLAPSTSCNSPYVGLCGLDALAHSLSGSVIGLSAGFLISRAKIKNRLAGKEKPSAEELERLKKLAYLY